MKTRILIGLALIAIIGMCITSVVDKVKVSRSYSFEELELEYGVLTTQYQWSYEGYVVFFRSHYLDFMACKVVKKDGKDWRYVPDAIFPLMYDAANGVTRPEPGKTAQQEAR